VPTYWCPFCGATFRWGKAAAPESVRFKMLSWVAHAWNCCGFQGGPWIPAGTNEEMPRWMTRWQAKRRAFIRDSVPSSRNPFSPWTRLPVCQSCGIVSGVSVASMLNGSAGGFEAQHILPLSQGGTNHPRNIAPLCRPCHVRTFRTGYRGVPGKPASLDRWEPWIT